MIFRGFAGEEKQGEKANAASDGRRDVVLLETHVWLINSSRRMTWPRPLPIIPTQRVSLQFPYALLRRPSRRTATRCNVPCIRNKFEIRNRLNSDYRGRKKKERKETEKRHFRPGGSGKFSHYCRLRGIASRASHPVFFPSPQMTDGRTATYKARQLARPAQNSSGAMRESLVPE